MDFKGALSIARGFRIGIREADRVQMARAYECMVHPAFYRSIGKNVSEEIERGIAVVIKLYGGNG